MNQVDRARKAGNPSQPSQASQPSHASRASHPSSASAEERRRPRRRSRRRARHRASRCLSRRPRPRRCSSGPGPPPAESSIAGNTSTAAGSVAVRSVAVRSVAVRSVAVRSVVAWTVVVPSAVVGSVAAGFAVVRSVAVRTAVVRRACVGAGRWSRRGVWTCMCGRLRLACAAGDAAQLTVSPPVAPTQAVPVAGSAGGWAVGGGGRRTGEGWSENGRGAVGERAVGPVGGWAADRARDHPRPQTQTDRGGTQRRSPAAQTQWPLT
ncbi:hypothetical protein ACG83_22345 [Frankia sp. R43]|nr:hypothetical protein ACG83_22345 [Frankia sp. R43]